MTERRTMVRLALSLAGSVAVVLVVFACVRLRTSPEVRLLNAAMSGIQECPHSWRPIYDRQARQGKKEPMVMAPPAGPGEGIAAVERITDIPEFHDCQKLVLPNGSYGPLIAIFASRHLDSLHTQPEIEVHSPPGGGGPIDLSALPTARHIGAVILNLGTTFQYEDFVIRRGFNCLYLWRSPAWRAMIIPVPTDSACVKPLVPEMVSSSIRYLKVLEDGSAGGVDSDYPPVARWDMDAAGRPYIGIKCGTAWCELGGINFVRNPPYSGPFASAEIQRVRRIKGWYDEQRLAVPGATGGVLMPGPLKGTLIPHPSLETYTLVDYDTVWAPVAYIALDGNGDAAYTHYLDKLGLARAPISAPIERLNRVEMCWGTAVTCKIPDARRPACVVQGNISALALRYWSKVTSPEGRTRYHCVLDIGHKNVPIPGTARWRWVLNDELSWTRCLEGCCEMDNRPDPS